VKLFLDVSTSLPSALMLAYAQTHNWGSEKKEGPVYHPGNQKNDGFGHLAFECDDVYKACAALEKQEVKFKKKPDEGRMKGLAFAYDPDGYWMEIIKRREYKGADHKLGSYSMAQTMLRVKVKHRLALTRTILTCPCRRPHGE
jgi:hypothetical protein